jgi:homoserine O-acetyltransferase
MVKTVVGLLLIGTALSSVASAQALKPAEGVSILKDFRFRSGESLPELRIHYMTLGTPRRDAGGVVRNAVLALHGTGGAADTLLNPLFTTELFGPGGLLDASQYFVIFPAGIGHGKSSKPSDGLRDRFPKYGYRDMVEAQYRLLTEGLGVNHLRLVIGTSMGGMHAWLWGETYPDFMDALMPLASLPTQISGRNRVWRRIAIDAIRNDPEWKAGNYVTQPSGLRTAVAMSYLMSSNPILRQQQMPTLAAADAEFDKAMAGNMKDRDANDVMYQLQASYDYDPGPALEEITAPLLAINFADDLINPPELQVLEREIGRVKRGRAIVLPLTSETRGHGSHTVAALWKEHLRELLSISAPSSATP